MPRRIVLSTSQRTLFESLPVELIELVKHYTLSKEDLVLIRKRRRSVNRLGFAIQLCLARYPGRILRPGEQLPQIFIEFIAEQTETKADDFAEYANRDKTRREHIASLIVEFKLTTFTEGHFREMIHWLVPVAVENPKSTFLVGAVLNELRHRRILYPPISVIERIVSIVEIKADRRVLRQVNSHLTGNHLESLGKWLIPEDKLLQSRMSWVRQPVGRPCPANVLVILERLKAIKQLQLPEVISIELPKHRQFQIAKEGRRIAIQNLRALTDARRYAVMAVTLQEIQCALIDEALSMHDKIIGRLIRRSQQKHTTQNHSDSKRIKRVISTFTILTKALTQAKENPQNTWEIIYESIGWDDLQVIIEDAEDLMKPKRLNDLYFVQAYYPQIRRYAPDLIEEFDFQPALGGQDVVQAIKLLRGLNTSGKRKLPENVPVSFITSMWKPLVKQKKGIDRCYYELCVLSELRNRLRSGDIWVSGSRQYQKFDSLLLGEKAFLEMRLNNAIPVAVETDCSKYIAERTTLLESRLEEVHKLAKNGKLDGVKIKDGRFSLKPYRGIPVPKEVKEFIQHVYAELPRIKITDLLVEVDSWTNFTNQFTHLRTGLLLKKIQGLLTVILSHGINLGLTSMAEASRGISLKELNKIEDWYVRDECYSRALAELVNYHHGMELTDSWGDGTTSSSDGQQFSLGGVAKELGHINPKYGSKPGVIFYTHISDQYSPFHTQLINTNIRDATFVLDGLLYHESDLNIEEHYTDTAGFTDHVFGLCHLLGFRFAPRIRGIGDLCLFYTGEAKRWPLFENIFGDRIKMHELKSQWEDILRFASSIRLGTVKASLLIRKLASYPRQNRLALAMRELGRIDRTIYMLDWIQDPKLRGRVQVGLNKGESRNALARAVFLNRLGEIRDRSFENQYYRASGLNLVVSAIILWNTVYLEKIIARIRKTQTVPEEYLTYLSPLGRDHINLTGDYVWNISENP